MSGIMLAIIGTTASGGGGIVVLSDGSFSGASLSDASFGG
jgi:hypothetical protein